MDVRGALVGRHVQRVHLVESKAFVEFFRCQRALPLKGRAPEDHQLAVRVAPAQFQALLIVRALVLSNCHSVNLPRTHGRGQRGQASVQVPSCDGGNDLLWIGVPDEWLWVVVGFGDEALDGGLKVGERSEDAALFRVPGSGSSRRPRGRRRGRADRRRGRRWRAVWRQATSRWTACTA